MKTVKSWDVQVSTMLGAKIAYASCKQGNNYQLYIAHNFETRSGNTASSSGGSLPKNWRQCKMSYRIIQEKNCVIKVTEFFIS